MKRIDKEAMYHSCILTAEMQSCVRAEAYLRALKIHLIPPQ